MPRKEWKWKLLVRVPDFVSEQDLAGALADLHAKRKSGPIDEVHLETLHEGPGVQMLHVGPYADETRTLDQMEAFAEAQGLRFHGAHHELPVRSAAGGAGADEDHPASSRPGEGGVNRRRQGHLSRR